MKEYQDVLTYRGAKKIAEAAHLSAEFCRGEDDYPVCVDSLARQITIVCNLTSDNGRQVSQGRGHCSLNEISQSDAKKIATKRAYVNAVKTAIKRASIEVTN